jgi:predicted secreted protein
MNHDLGAIVLYRRGLVSCPSYIVLPVQADARRRARREMMVPGTHASAPANPQVGRKARITTLVAVVLWAILAAVLMSNLISVEDFDWFDRMDRVSADAPAG